MTLSPFQTASSVFIGEEDPIHPVHTKGLVPDLKIPRKPIGRGRGDARDGISISEGMIRPTFLLADESGSLDGLEVAEVGLDRLEHRDDALRLALLPLVGLLLLREEEP